MNVLFSHYKLSYNDIMSSFYFFKGGLTLRQEEPTTDDPEAEFEPDAICKLVLIRKLNMI